MNYGRYFRLNQALSKVVDGVAIYDYVDLPAYFGPSEDNPMSPKYPISVTITSETVCFRLHYSAFKLDKSGDCEFPQYAYDIDDINKKTLNRKQVDIGMAHMEEVVLELPFSDISSSSLSDTIKNIYNSTFPQVIDENTSMGGRYLEQLIKKRFPIKKDEQSESVEDILYKNLRKVSDETSSYSTLWLMDLVRDNRIYLYSKQKVIDDETKKEKEINVITGFLRKLLLDFMFDLKHSDVFQNSACYQKMFSGLMSDFYFSALMHKCEYYYYRKLTSQVIGDFEKNKTNLTNKDIKARKDAIATLYANELIKAETLWIQDITNPLAEKCFDYKFYNATYNNYIVRKLSEYCIYISSVFLERLTIDSWPSWFAEPEEEMRRVCFPMIENGYKVICNADTLVNYLCLETHVGDDSKKMVQYRNEIQEKISQWFLKRYDFNDLIHLHTFKHLNQLLIISIVYILFQLFTNKKISVSIFEDIKWCKDNSICLLSVLFTLLTIQFYLCSKWNKMVFIHIWSKIKKILLVGCIFGVTGYCFYQNDEMDFLFLGLLGSMVFLICMFGFLSAKYEVPYVRYLSPPSISPVSYIHLMLPRLVSAITAAWLTISLGFDIYVSFFDSEPSWPTAMAISLIVLGFIMYEINRIMPRSTSIRKLYRSLELLFLSYGISLLVGLVVINFVGEKFLERGGYIGDYYEQHVDEKLRVVDTIAYNSNANGEILNDSQWVTYGKAIINRLNDINDPNDIPNIKKVENLQKVTKADHKIVEVINILGFKIFFMRDFLIMFSFIAMFWGIFIQMIFTGEKQMTEL